MQAGRELDDLVAQHVMGWELETVNIMISNYWKNENGFICYPRHFRPSEDIKDAWEVLRELRKERGCTFALATLGNSIYIEIKAWIDGKLELVAQHEAESAPHAICLAALQTLGVDVERGE